MKKIINGKVYDTEKATMVDEFHSGNGWRDFHYIHEQLFRKRTGEYFIFGEGGPATKYAERVEQNCWGSGERIIPLSYENAKAWAEEHMTADDYEKEFGVIEDDDSSEIVTLSLKASTAEKLRRAAREKETSMAAILEELINKI